MIPLYPLRFEPLFRRYLWGGRRLATVLGKELGEGDDYAESWEIVDHGTDQSIVRFGPLAGTPLGELMRDRRGELVGAAAAVPGARFPLLFKFLDANQRLSVQVHPNDEQAARQAQPDLGKTEAWVILHADPGSVIYAGLKRGFDRPAFERELQRGTAELCLHRFEPQPGDCVFIPAGVVHALGAGLVIAEIQQSSDTTFRLFDWNRRGKDGQPRPLHIHEGLQVIDFERGPIEPQRPAATDQPHVQQLVACEKFVLDRWHWDGSKPLGGDGRFHILAVLNGTVEISGDPAGQPLRTGETLLLPAATGPVSCHSADPATMLDIYLPC